ncbi:zinc ribbon domain-containing protein [Candidatus Peregrinibacteria bacterium]|nr:zinc ribbon domain-containing protein [Candidatus Peregrinibacteria bacterium]
MKRCTYCFRYSLSTSPYCNHCGRSFNVRLCSRGHINRRDALFCAECGSGDLSTPAPPASFLFHLSQWTLRLVIGFAIAVALFSLVAGLLYSLDWSAIGPRLVLLAFMLLFLYWTTMLLPGPVRKVGKAAGRTAWNAMTNKRKSK